MKIQNATVINTDSNETAQYEIFWSLPKEDVEYEFNVTICSDQCQSIDKPATETSMEYPLPYDEDYNITVATIYKLPLQRIVITSSQTHKGKSTVGSESAFDHIL